MISMTASLRRYHNSGNLTLATPIRDCINTNTKKGPALLTLTIKILSLSSTKSSAP